MDVPVMDGVEPVTVTGNVPPVAKVHESMAVPEPVTVVGLRVQWLSLLVSDTTPVNPVLPVTVIVAVPAVFGKVLMVPVLANIWKSTTWTFTVAVVWLSGPLEPLTDAV